MTSKGPSRENYRNENKQTKQIAFSTYVDISNKRVNNGYQTDTFRDSI
jgi:hypothetical protein